MARDQISYKMKFRNAIIATWKIPAHLSPDIEAPIIIAKYFLVQPLFNTLVFSNLLIIIILKFA